MSEVNITLQFPIRREDGSEVSALSFRRPRLKDLCQQEKVSGGSHAQGAAMIGMLSGLAPADVALLDVADYLRIDAALQDFFVSAPATGGS